MRCYECGYLNDEGVKVCVKCGTKLSDSGQSGNAPNPNKKEKSADEGPKTMRGQAAAAPSWDTPKSGAAKGDFIKCPSCGYYPLKDEPNTENPCPNCSYSGESKEEVKPAAGASSASKTVNISDLNIGGKDPVLRLKDEGSGKVYEFDGDRVTISRDDIDPNNNSISSDTHAEFKFANGGLQIEDKSSNGATFVQAAKPTELAQGTRIVIGNKIFIVEFES